MMKEAVEVMDTFPQWDPEIVRRDWEEKVLPHLPRSALIPALFAENPDEEMFTYVHRPKINEILKGTIFEEVLSTMPINLNRAVFIYIPEGMGLRHHMDPDNKYHLSVVENPGSFYYSYDTQRGYHLPADGKIRKINSAETHHTAFNGGVDGRIHLVMTEYECDDLKPEKLFVSRTVHDYSNCTLKDQFTGKRDLGSTIEQNFTMPLTRYSYNTRKVHKLNATKDGESRVYEIYWTDEQAMHEAYNSDLYWKTYEALKEFGIDMSYEIY